MKISFLSSLALSLGGAVLVLLVPTCSQAAPSEPAYTPSAFPGVQVRHVPQAKTNSSVLASPHGPTSPLSTKGFKGVRVRNVRRASDPRNGWVADVDVNLSSRGLKPAPLPPHSSKAKASKTLRRPLSRLGR